MAITNEQYGFIISLCEWNNPDVPELKRESEVPTRQTVRSTLDRIRASAVTGGFRELVTMMDFMLDLLTRLNDNEVQWFRRIEADVRSNFG